jgi:hypothetical protein
LPGLQKPVTATDMVAGMEAGTITMVAGAAVASGSASTQVTDTAVATTTTSIITRRGTATVATTGLGTIVIIVAIGDERGPSLETGAFSFGIRIVGIGAMSSNRLERMARSTSQVSYVKTAKRKERALV